MTRFEQVITKYLPLFRADFDCSLDDACAVFGNLAHECKGFTTLQEEKPLVKGSRGGFGWAQWTGSRRREYEAYCERNGFNPAHDEANYKFLYVELKLKGYGLAVSNLDRYQALAAKVEAFERAFLRSGIKHYPSRIDWALKVRRVAQGIKPAASPPKAAPPKLAPVPAPAAVVKTASQTEITKETTSMKELVKKLIGNFVRHGLTAAAAVLVANGWLSAEDAANAVNAGTSVIVELVAAVIMGGVGMGWSIGRTLKG